MAKDGKPVVVAAASLTSGSVLVDDVCVAEVEEPLARKGDVVDTALIGRLQEHEIDAVRVQPPEADSETMALNKKVEEERAAAESAADKDKEIDEAAMREQLEAVVRTALGHITRRFKRCDLTDDRMRALVNCCALSRAHRSMRGL